MAILFLRRLGFSPGAKAYDTGKLSRVFPEDLTLCKAKFSKKFFVFNSLLDVVSSKT